MRTLRVCLALAVALGAGACVLVMIRWLTPTKPIPLPQREEVSITIVEGTTIDDLARQLERDFSVPATTTRALIGASVDRAPFDPAYRLEYPFLASLPRTRSLEGYLFPDTYRVWKDELPTALIDKQLTKFQRTYGSMRDRDAMLILASIVEREVRTPKDYAHVACVFQNRLRIGMALQSDATLEYITQSKRSRATSQDLALTNAYNTYKHAGLPPGPISLPGAAAIEGVLHPAACDDFYFLTDPQGNVLYGKTFEQHQRNRARAGM